MKPLHECAIIKDGNKRVGYLIAQTNNCADKEIFKKQWGLVEATKFEDLVRNNQVQFLIMENNTIKCKYTLEEINIMKKSMKSFELLQQMQDNYWSMDIAFKYRHMMAAMEGQALACCLATVTKILNLHMVCLVLCGNTQHMERFVNDLTMTTRYRFDRTFSHNGHNIGQIIVPDVHINTLISLGQKYGMMIDTSTMKFILKNNIQYPRIKIIQGKVEPEKALGIVNTLDRLTLDSERILNI